MSFKWRMYSLEEISKDISYGYTASAHDEKVGPKFLRITDIRNYFVDWDSVPYCEIDEQNKVKYKLEIGDLCIARTGATTGINTVIKKQVDAVFASYLIRFRLNKELVNPFFVGYVLSSRLWLDYVTSIIGGSAQPGANAKQLSKFTISIPPLGEQNAITRLLSSLDDKIELNNAINKNLEEMAQALFKHWFVDFEFPNENGEPYKSSGGEFEESELGLIPKGWSTGKFRDISHCYDSKRIPLSKKERESRVKIYPYYGAASLMDYVDNFLFEGVHVLMGEDGTVIDDEGFPVLQYVWGKFWVNNHAHVVKGNSGFTEEYIYLLLKRTNVRHIVTGAVQPKINQTNMNSIKVIIPDNVILDNFNQVISGLFKLIRENIDQNQSLSNIRDTLLPKLMSGEIRVTLD